MVIVSHTPPINGQEKQLRHVAMVAKFLDDNKPKIHLKVNSHCFKLHRSFSISFNLSNVGEIFWIESERAICEIRKRKRNFLCCVHLLRKVGACRSRATTAKKCAKKSDARAKLLFYCYKFIAFFAVLVAVAFVVAQAPFVLIQTFWYHGNVTSHSPLYWM